MLLFDHNLSPRLVSQLADAFPGSVAVSDIGLARADDRVVWRYAADHGLIVVSKDVDFVDLAVLSTPPPHLVLLTLGNSTTGEVDAALREAEGPIKAMPGSEFPVLLVG